MATMEEDNAFVVVDLEQQQQQDLGGGGSSSASSGALEERQVLREALADVAECRAKLKALGEPPEHEALEEARAALTSIDAALASNLERLQVAAQPATIDRHDWTTLQAQKENDLHEAARIAKLPYQAIIQTDELHRSYELLLRDAELDLVRLSTSLDSPLPSPSPSPSPQEEEEEGVNEEVARILLAAKEGPVTKVDLKGRGLTRVPDAFGRIPTIVSLDLSSNHLKVLSDSIGGLINLQTLNLENNNLESLPDSIGLLKNVKVLNVSSNKLIAFPESILECRSLVSLNANLNQLSYLPSQIGFTLLNLQHLSLQWNKLRSLPTSTCNLKSLKCLEVRFNHLKALPSAIGNLNNLELLDASCNFMDLQTVPDTIGDLVSLVEINLSCNQIRTLPDSFGRLQNLKKINIKDNPLVIPPLEVAEAGTDAIMAFMKERWQNFLEGEKQCLLAEESQQQNKWFPQALGGSWLTRVLFGVADRTSPQASFSEDYLEQQL